MTASVDSEAAAPPGHQRGHPYEIHRDAFLYFAMGEHLRFLAMDFPPAIAMLFGGDAWPARRLDLPPRRASRRGRHPAWVRRERVRGLLWQGDSFSDRVTRPIRIPRTSSDFRSRAQIADDGTERIDRDAELVYHIEETSCSIGSPLSASSAHDAREPGVPPPCTAVENLLQTRPRPCATTRAKIPVRLIHPLQAAPRRPPRAPAP